jgi:hypothetical protein
VVRFESAPNEPLVLPVAAVGLVPYRRSWRAWNLPSPYPFRHPGRSFGVQVRNPPGVNPPGVGRASGRHPLTAL